MKKLNHIQKEKIKQLRNLAYLLGNYGTLHGVEDISTIRIKEELEMLENEMELYKDRYNFSPRSNYSLKEIKELIDEIFESIPSMRIQDIYNSLLKQGCNVNYNSLRKILADNFKCNEAKYWHLNFSESVEVRK